MELNRQSIKCMRATIRAANPADVAHYRRVMANYEEYPYEGEGDTDLARAVWAQMHGQLGDKQEGRMKHDYDAAAINRFIERKGWTGRELARRAGVSPDVIYKILSDAYPCKGPAVRKVMALMERDQPAVDQQAAGETLRWLQGMIEGGKVKSIEIRMEVGA